MTRRQGERKSVRGGKVNDLLAKVIDNQKKKGPTYL